MALVTKNDVTQIFAIQAPEVDLPPTFANYPRGWDAARINEGKPTIKQFNYIQQRTDQNVLWIHQNGAALPYDAAMEYAENAHVVKDGELQKKQGSGWVSATNKGYNLDYFVSGKSYPLHAEITLTNGDTVKSTEPNNTKNPNVDMVGWTYSDGLIASQIRSINNFASFIAASEWLKGDDSRFIQLTASKRYVLPENTDLFFSRYFCENGFAEIVVPDTCNLRYLNKSDGSDVFYIKGIRYLVLGKRSLATESTTAKWVYHTDQRGTAPVKRIYIENIEAYALTDINNMDSWVDNVGQSRCVGFLPIEYSDSSYVRKVNHYGFRTFYSSRSSKATASHHEESVHGFNNEANVIVSIGAGYISGNMSDIKIFNTPEQKTYYYNMANISNVAGLDAVLLEGKHSGKCTIFDIGGQNIHERSLYAQSDNLFLDQISDEGSYSPLNTKQGHGRVFAKNITAFSTTSGGGKCPFYGYDFAQWDGFTVSDSGKSANICFTFAYGGEYQLKNGAIENLASPFYLSIADTNPITKVYLENIEVKNCFSNLRANVWSNLTAINGTLGELEINGLRHDVGLASPVDIFARSFDFKSITKVKMSGVKSASSNYPFDAVDCNNITAKNCDFKILSNTTIYNAFTRLEAATGFKAKDFDFNVDLIQTTDAVKIPFSIKMKGYNDTQIQCATAWSEITASVPVTESGNAARRLAKLDLYSFKAVVSFKKSQYEFVYDAETKTVTPLYNIGSAFSGSQVAGKIAVYVNASDGGLIVYPFGEWVGGFGDVKIKLNRF